MAKVTFQQRSQLRRARQILRDAGILCTPDQTLRAKEHARSVERWVKQEEDNRAARREQYRKDVEEAERIRKQLLKAETPPVKTGRKLIEDVTPGIAAAMAEKYAKGHSAARIALAFGCSNVTVLRLLRKHGADIRVGSGSHLKPKVVVAANLQPANAPSPAPRVEPVREPDSIIRTSEAERKAMLMAGRAIPFRKGIHHVEVHRS